MKIFIFCAALALAAPGTWAKELKVLMIGNSFSVSVMRHLPAAAQAANCDLHVCNLYIGGCSLERHWTNITKASNPAFKPYAVSQNKGVKAFRANIPEMLVTQKWDIVTIQQASPLSWQPGSYHPYADRLIAKIRELAPQAEIVIQQTWAYCSADERIRMPGAKWGFDQQGMYDRLTTNYLALARQYRFRVIPTGLAVQKARKELPVTFKPLAPEALKALVEPALPDLGGEVVGRYGWQKQKTGKSLFWADPVHLNPSGEYLQACVWLGFLFPDVNLASLPYVPVAAGGAARAAVLRSCAAEALREGIR